MKVNDNVSCIAYLENTEFKINKKIWSKNWYIDIKYPVYLDHCIITDMRGHDCISKDEIAVKMCEQHNADLCLDIDTFVLLLNNHKPSYQEVNVIFY